MNTAKFNQTALMPQSQDKLTWLLEGKLELLPQQNGAFLKLQRPIQNHQEFAENRSNDKSCVMFRAICRLYH